jgi:hypothetical protein
MSPARNDDAGDAADEIADDVEYSESLDEESRRNRDGVASLRDVEAESGDEEALDDEFDLDDREARELGVELDGRNEREPRLD